MQLGAGDALGEAEVGELEPAGGGAGGEEDVGGFEVSVDDDGVEALEVLQGGEDVERPGAHLHRSAPQAAVNCRFGA